MIRLDKVKVVHSESIRNHLNMTHASSTSSYINSPTLRRNDREKILWTFRELSRLFHDLYSSFVGATSPLEYLTTSLTNIFCELPFFPLSVILSSQPGGIVTTTASAISSDAWPSRSPQTPRDARSHSAELCLLGRVPNSYHTSYLGSSSRWNFTPSWGPDRLGSSFPHPPMSSLQIALLILHQTLTHPSAHANEKGPSQHNAGITASPQGNDQVMSDEHGDNLKKRSSILVLGHRLF